jgi:hypothetical protein
MPEVKMEWWATGRELKPMTRKSLRKALAYIQSPRYKKMALERERGQFEYIWAIRKGGAR